MTVRPLHHRLLPLAGLVLATAVSVSACGDDASPTATSTTSSASTASRVTPYFTHMSPPAPVAIVPPMLAHARLAGSGA